MDRSSWIATGAVLAMLASAVPADAQVARFDPGVSGSASALLTHVQFRGGRGFHRFHGGGFGGRGFRGGFGHRGFGHRGFGYGGGYHRGFGRGRGAAIGAGVAGLAAGALIGGALASQAGPGYGYGYDPGTVYAPPPPVPAGDATAYCAQRFKSYDAASGTYLGYDGQRHPCP